MKAFILVEYIFDEEVVQNVYQAETAQDVWSYLYETELELTNDSVKAERDREKYYRNHKLIDTEIIVIQ
mgnify:FL=1